MGEIVKMFRGKYGFLSNMSRADFQWDGRTYRNSEAAFQSAKSLDPAERASFSQMTGVEAKRAGKRVALRPDWEEVKVSVMAEVVREKFIQNPDLAQKLVKTDDAELVEGNNWHDTFWGVDLASGVGENHLGVILMALRAELAQQNFSELAEQRRAERAAAARAELTGVCEALEALEGERKSVEAALEALPAVEYAGMACRSRAFGRGTILRQEGQYITFDANGVEKKFIAPDCFLRGFLISDDADVLPLLRRRQELEAHLAELRPQLDELARRRDALKALAGE